MFFFFLCRKPKTRRSKRFLQNREPKLTENSKNAMIMKGGNTSETVTFALKDIVRLQEAPVSHASHTPVSHNAFGDGNLRWGGDP